jgi:hypothetical protein
MHENKEYIKSISLKTGIIKKIKRYIPKEINRYNDNK